MNGILKFILAIHYTQEFSFSTTLSTLGSIQKNSFQVFIELNKKENSVSRNTNKTEVENKNKIFKIFPNIHSGLSK